MGKKKKKGVRRIGDERPTRLYVEIGELSALPRKTSVTYSDLHEDGSVSVRVTTPNGRFASCELPEERWDADSGLDAQELAEARDFVADNAGLIEELAREEAHDGGE